MQCRCKSAGFCPRYNRVMSEHSHRLCMFDARYRRLWSEKWGKPFEIGPPTDLPSCRHRGDPLAVLTSPVGGSRLIECDALGMIPEAHCFDCIDREPTATFEKEIGSPGKGQPVRKWAACVTTAPRRSPTIDQCIRSIRAAGWEPRIFAEPESLIPDVADGLTIVRRAERLGAWMNTYLALTELHAVTPDADAYILFQDDVTVTYHDGRERLREYLERALWPSDGRVGIVSLYTSRKYSSVDRLGWIRLPGRWLWGACAIIFPRDCLVSFLSSTGIRWRMTGPANGMRNVDLAIGRWQKSKRLEAWYPLPSLVQHIGDTSTLWRRCRATGDRRASVYFGDVI